MRHDKEGNKNHHVQERKGVGELYVTKCSSCNQAADGTFPKKCFNRLTLKSPISKGQAQTSPAGLHLLTGSGPSHRLVYNCPNVIQVRLVVCHVTSPFQQA